MPSFSRWRESTVFSVISQERHSRVRGNDGRKGRVCLVGTQSLRRRPHAVILATLEVQRLQCHLSRTSFPRRRALLYFGGAEHPETSAPFHQVVIPAKAGI
ncbi:hypothetical protein [Lysobacter gummosus]|uniref:hypothetical protein n=1 Tax=Lysobacter gummosus TaxID=262324 RepID=UPI0036366F71